MSLSGDAPPVPPRLPAGAVAESESEDVALVAAGPPSLASVLTLGEADFTFSYDLARHLSSHPATAGGSLSLTATAYDTLEASKEKYSSLPSTLKKIMQVTSLSRRQLKKRKAGKDSVPNPVSVRIIHGVNALDPYASSLPKGRQFDRIIFNHPHLGREDMHAHARFIAHFFDAVTKTDILKASGAIHLTFAGGGQAVRWRVQEMAERNNYSCVDKRPFSPPPVTSNCLNSADGQCYLTWRRGYSGRGFKAAGQSECLTFVRTDRVGSFGLEVVVDGCSFALPWMLDPPANGNDDAKDTSKGKGAQAPPASFSCPACNRAFSDRRSLANHLKDSKRCAGAGAGASAKASATGKKNSESNDSNNNNSNGNNNNNETYRCNDCSKTFGDEASLRQHMNQKHGFHKTAEMRPHWCTSTNVSCPRVNEAVVAVNGDGNCCKICGVNFTADFTAEMHKDDFLLVEAPILNCGFCSKPFREIRSLRQHENSCVNRIVT